MFRVLWPQVRWQDGNEPELSFIEEGFQAEFVENYDDILFMSI